MFYSTNEEVANRFSDCERHAAMCAETHRISSISDEHFGNGSHKLLQNCTCTSEILTFCGVAFSLSGFRRWELVKFVSRQHQNTAVQAVAQGLAGKNFSVNIVTPGFLFLL